MDGKLRSPMMKYFIQIIKNISNNLFVKVKKKHHPFYFLYKTSTITCFSSYENVSLFGIVMYVTFLPYNNENKHAIFAYYFC